MNSIDPKHLALVIGKREPSVFKDYVDFVANRGLLRYKNVLQYGKKAGESLYTHILDGVFVLEQLRPALKLSDIEAQVLYTAFTLHDLNKVRGDGQRYGELITRENVVPEIEALNLERFFPDYADYLEDIMALDLAHSAHHHYDGAGLVRSYDPYGLGRERVEQLKHLIRAADAVDLSHTLEERSYKEDFLFHLNTFSDVQYEFVTHQLTEDRGLLSNVVHESVVTYLRDTLGLIPLLFYPDGVAYLKPGGETLTLEEPALQAMGGDIAEAISEMTAEQLPDFVESKPGGIKITRKCLQLGVPFQRIWKVAHGKAAIRAERLLAKVEEMEAQARNRAEGYFEKNAQALPEAAEQVRMLLEAEAPLISMDRVGLIKAELARAYYIFIKEHFPQQADDPWYYVYRVLDLPEEKWATYEYFVSPWDRPYVIARDIALSEEEVARRFAEDGASLLNEAGVQDPKVALFTDYVKRHVIFDFGGPRQVDFGAYLQHYEENQHNQCVMCSSTLPTQKWMKGDVRDDITVQAFSNRLRGGPGDPKKQICPLCRIQFLLEKLNYPQVRNENILYLHLFPYAFLTAPYIQGLRVGLQRLTREDVVERALFLRQEQAIASMAEDQPLHLDFTALTKSGKSHSYGLYLPRYSRTVGNRIIFPLNPAGQNDTERFLFALWYAMLLQKYFGVKVLLSASPVAPLDKEHFHDLYVSDVPLNARGLLRRNDYAAYKEDTAEPGTLAVLWEQVRALFAFYQLTRSADTRRNELVAMVQSLGESPLHVFYTAEKLLETRADDREWRLIRLSQRAFPYVETLVKSIGGTFMTKLSQVLKRLAGIAWESGLRGRSLKKNALMAPLDEIFKKLSLQSEAADLELLRAAVTEDIFEHLQRIADAEYKPGKRKWQATQEFVNVFFDEVYKGVYGGKLQKLLADEKLIRSAYMFYIREEIPRKSEEEA
ncbi:MAG: type I-D CRISPR-associated protein Cas10d/Csc3 [Anaerolineae bacterium]